MPRFFGNLVWVTIKESLVKDTQTKNGLWIVNLMYVSVRPRNEFYVPWKRRARRHIIYCLLWSRNYLKLVLVTRGSRLCIDATVERDEIMENVFEDEDLVSSRENYLRRAVGRATIGLKVLDMKWDGNTYGNWQQEMSEKQAKKKPKGETAARVVGRLNGMAMKVDVPLISCLRLTRFSAELRTKFVHQRSLK